MKYKTVTSKDGTKIAYDKIGHGPVVILVLGALNSRKSGTKLAKLLASSFTVISYDRRGRGDSTDTAPYAPGREVEDIAALINEVGEPVYFYGHSSGAAIVLEAASKMRKQIKKIAIYEAPYTLDGDAGKAAKEYNKQLKKLLASGCNGDAVSLFVRNVGVSDKQIQAMKSMPMWRGLEALAPTLAYDSDVLGEGHALPTSLLAGITTPALVMHGGKGAPSMRDAAQAISEAIPKAQLRTLAGQTHGVSPKVLVPILTEFFSG
ncbi:MAG: alpha/beta hydrolase [Anaerolineaceae bacterium]|nr:alpha/beta hydrolase [Anaerolineaceae bacterium]